jgi:hypothetical protein
MGGKSRSLIFPFPCVLLIQMYRTVKGTAADRSCAAGKKQLTNMFVSKFSASLQKHFFFFL